MKPLAAHPLDSQERELYKKGWNACLAAISTTPPDGLAAAVLDLNTGWNNKEPEHLIAERIDLCRRLAV